MSAAVDGGTTIATKLGGSLADAALSEVGTIAIGQLMSVIGWDPTGQGAITGQLDTIISMLNTLETAISNLAADMEKMAAQADYDTVAQKAETLAVANLAIARRLKDYAAASDADRPVIEADVKRLMKEAEIDQSPEAWHSILCGSEGSTGLLEAWNRLVKNSHPIFGPDATKALQQHWEHVDGQQALSISHCVELINAGALDAADKKSSVQDVYDTWRANRALQLAKLRGMKFYSDDMEFLVAGAKETVTTPILALPQSTTVVGANGQLLMCFLNLRGPVSRGGDDLVAFRNSVNFFGYDAGMATGVGGDDTLVNSEPGPLSWNLRTRDEMPGILNALGGSVGQSQDLFADALKAQGFVGFPDGQLRLWGDGPEVQQSSDAPGPQRGMPHYRGGGTKWAGVVFVEGESWWDPSTNPDDSAMLLLVRPVPDTETANYWYAN